jgi:hypothetical protein
MYDVSYQSAAVFMTRESNLPEGCRDDAGAFCWILQMLKNLF